MKCECTLSSSLFLQISKFVSFTLPLSPNPRPMPKPDVSKDPDGLLLIPWRGREAQAPIGTSPSLLKAIATIQTRTKKDKNLSKTTIDATKPQKLRTTASPPKAARRFQPKHEGLLRSASGKEHHR
ncbi:hypothetical protein VNO80_01615 [Phaseolus coccineus]|uniref:Uncharacterized protein n=1 Tax=Phaseolus coccineus TaxID=3886 RepID=A0AAN9WZE8_PHACN